MKLGILIILVFISLSLQTYAAKCKVYTEDVLFSSGFNLSGDSVAYYSWLPENKCDNCYIKSVYLYGRPLGSGETTETLAMIKFNNDCKHLQDLNYDVNAFKLSTKKEAKFVWDCGKNAKKNACNLNQNISCAGIKLFAGKEAILDVTKIKYELCEHENKNYSLIVLLLIVILSLTLVFWRKRLRWNLKNS